jgi:multidrug efflux system membrane fusion protein
MAPSEAPEQRRASEPPVPLVTEAHPPLSARKSRKWRILFIVTIVAVFAVVGVRMIRDRQPGEGKPGGERAGLPPVPVLGGAVEKKDVPIYLDGLGTVQALNTVTVRARVDGEIKKIAFSEGQDVKAGDLLVLIDEAPFRAAYDQAVAKKGQDEAQLANAQADLERYNDLAGKKVISSQQFDTQKALVRQFDATVKADEAAVSSAKVQLDYTKVVAPIDGRTGIRLVDQGNIVHASDPSGLVVLTQIQPISLVFTLPEQNLGAIDKEVAGDGRLTVIAVDRDNKTVLEEGKLSVIDNQIDTTTGTIKLKAVFPNEHLKLWPGQFVNARLLLEVRKDGLVVPASVVQRGPQGTFAFVIKPDETVEMRPVKVGPIEQGQVLIEDGLQVGERVVVDGQYKLQKGSRVKISDGTGKPGGGGRPVK